MESTEEYVYLTCTAHGTPLWTTEGNDLPNSGVWNSGPVRKLGPYLIGKEGYDDIEEALENDPEFLGSLDDPSSWFDNPQWISIYLDDGRYSESEGCNESIG